MPERRLRLTGGRLLAALLVAIAAVLAVGWPGRAALGPGLVTAAEQASPSPTDRHRSPTPKETPTTIVVSPVVTDFPTPVSPESPTPSDIAASPTPTLITTEVTASPVPIGGAGVGILPSPTPTTTGAPSGSRSLGGLPWPFVVGALALFALAAGAAIYAFSPRRAGRGAAPPGPSVQFTPYGTEISKRPPTVTRRGPASRGPNSLPLPRSPRKPRL